MFGENHRISHRQLYRQVILSLLAPFVLALPGWQNLQGINGVFGVLLTLAVWAGLVIFLVRIAPAYEHLYKYAGKIASLIIGVLYGVFLLFTGAYLLDMMQQITGTYLLTGVPGWLISLLAVVVCVAGTHMGMEKRGRMGEVSFVIIFGVLLLLILLSVCQKEQFSTSQFWRESLSQEKILTSFWGSFGAFLPLTLLPFALSGTSRPQSAGKILYGSILTMAGMLLVLMYLLPIMLGWDRMTAEPMPILPYMAGTNLPGDLLARFDVIWVGILLYGLLFSLGSVFYYCHHIFGKIKVPVPHYLWGALVYGISVIKIEGISISIYYPWIFSRFFAPVLLLLLLWVYILFRRRRKEK